MSDPTTARPASKSTTGPDALGGAFPLAGISVARIGYGAMQLEHHAGNPDAAASVLRIALDSGVNHVDTAEFYGNGFVNDVIRRTVGNRDDVLVATKVGATPNPAGPIPLKAAQKPDELRASVDDNLRSLGRDRLDLVYLRRLDAGPGLRAQGDQDVPLDDQLEVMTAMRDDGKIGALGISAVTIDGLRRALPAGIAAVQNAYSMVDRQFEEMMRLTVQEQIAWVPFFPLGSGFPGHAKVAEQPAVKAAAERLGVTPAQVGLAWLLQRTPNTLIIPGTGDATHLVQNLAAAEIVFDAQTLAELGELTPIGGGEIQWVPEEG